MKGGGGVEERWQEELQSFRLRVVLPTSRFVYGHFAYVLGRFAY